VSRLRSQLVRNIACLPCLLLPCLLLPLPTCLANFIRSHPSPALLPAPICLTFSSLALFPLSFDNAEVYANGEAEKIMGQALKELEVRTSAGLRGWSLASVMPDVHAAVPVAVSSRS
jgi:hypothetical protein